MFPRFPQSLQTMSSCTLLNLRRKLPPLKLRKEVTSISDIRITSRNTKQEHGYMIYIDSLPIHTKQK